MATGAKTELFVRQQKGGMFAVINEKVTTGSIFFVDSNTGTDGAGYGRNPSAPVATIDYAIGLCTASKGDVIIVMPGHSETLTTAITCDVAGVSIIGQGKGSLRPQLTVNANIDAITITAANVRIENILFNEGTNAHTARINIAAAFAEIVGCHFDCGANDLESITIAAAGTDALIKGNVWRITANGPDAAIEIEAAGATRLVVEDNFFDGGSDTNKWDAAAINSGAAHTLCRVRNNTFMYGAGIAFTAAATGVIEGNHFALGTLGSMLDPGSCICIDNWEQDAIDEAAVISPRTVNPDGIGDGAIQADTIGSNAITAAKIASDAIAAAKIAADAITNAKIADDALSDEQFDVDATGKVRLGPVVEKATGAISEAGDVNLFTVAGGLVMITSLTGEVTVQIGADQDHTLKHGTTDIATLLACDSDAVGTLYGISGSPSDALIEGNNAGLIGPTTPLIVNAGTIKLTVAGNTFAGEITWRLTYVPIEAGATVSAVA